MGSVAVGRLEAENAVLGAMLLDEALASKILAAIDPADIYDPGNKRIYQAARALLREGATVDPVAICGKLGKVSEERLLQLMEITPTTANWREYAAIMHEQAALQRIKDLAVELTDADTLDQCRDKIATLGEVLSTGTPLEVWSMGQAYRHFMAAQAADSKREYITYGIRELDEGTYTEPGDVVVIGGEPSAGKTAFALAIAYHMGKTHKVGFFSLETTREKLTDRLVAGGIGIDFNRIKQQSLDEDDWQKVAQSGDDFTRRSVSLIRSSGMTVDQIAAVSRSYGFDVIFVDYVQLIRADGRSRGDRYNEVSAISRELHTFAQSTGTLVVELAQLSRPAEKGKWAEPSMHSLRETGQLEQDADAIMLLYRPKPGSDMDPDKHRILKIAKQKEGRVGKWPLYFDGVHQSFSVMAGYSGRSVQQKLVDSGKRIKALHRAQDRAQEFIELPDDPKSPF